MDSKNESAAFSSSKPSSEDAVSETQTENLEQTGQPTEGGTDETPKGTKRKAERRGKNQSG